MNDDLPFPTDAGDEFPLAPETILPRQVIVRDVSDRPPREPEYELSARWQRRQRMSWILFGLTCVSTWYVGAQTFPEILRPDGTALAPAEIATLTAETAREQRLQILPGYRTGLHYALAVMGILLAHEMGHYLQARRYRVPATLPFFIPMPISPFGTMGAVILQGAGTADRKSMFDIAVSGPLAGLVIAIPVLIFGIHESTYALVTENSMIYGDPLLVKMIASAIHGPALPGQELTLTPLLFAGWVGVFITSLNLIPVGQLDGGHILYCLLGRKAHDLALMIVGFAAAYCVFVDPSYVVIIVLLLMMGVKHPPTRNDRMPIGRARVILGWLTLSFIIIGFTPRPITLPTGGPSNGDAVQDAADYGDVEAANNVRRPREVLATRVAVRNTDHDSTGIRAGSSPRLTVLKNQHFLRRDSEF